MKLLSSSSWRRFDVGSCVVVFLLLASLLAAWVLYPRARPGPGQGDITEIVYWTATTANEAEKLAIAEFERRNPQYRVALGTATVKDATGDPTRFLLGVAGGVPPDLIFLTGSQWWNGPAGEPSRTLLRL